MNDTKTAEKRVKETAREDSERVQESSSRAAEGLRDCQTTILLATQANINAIFEYMQEALKARSLPEFSRYRPNIVSGN
jgi:Phasin protein